MKILYFLYCVPKLIEVTWGGREINPPPPVFFLPKNSFLLATEFKRANKKIGVRVGERGICILGTGSNQSSLSF